MTDKTLKWPYIDMRMHIRATLVWWWLANRGSRDDMAAMAEGGGNTPQGGLGGAGGVGDHGHATLMEDPDVWRPN